MKYITYVYQEAKVLLSNIEVKLLNPSLAPTSTSAKSGTATHTGMHTHRVTTYAHVCSRMLTYADIC